MAGNANVLINNRATSRFGQGIRGARAAFRLNTPVETHVTPTVRHTRPSYVTGRGEGYGLY